VFVLSAFSRQITAISREKSFWLSLAIYLLSCALLDFTAIRLGWWSFSIKKICGLRIAEVPVEEFILFILIFLLTLSAWEASADELA
jgi:lycopene cyclase domain-containing protein